MNPSVPAPRFDSRSPSFELTVYVSQRSTTHDLGGGTRMIVGRSRGSDIVIPDETVSRIHAAITVQRGEVLVEDLGSNNGTEWVSGGRGAGRPLEPGRPVSVLPGDLLRFGGVSALVQREPDGPNSSMNEGLTAPPVAWDGPLVREPTMRSLYDLAARAARSEISVLVTGETGVGKEHVASEIHRLSSRSAAPFMQLNCAALSESLLESELFGHERGAFTGATGRREGVFESACGGTLFLDEVGEMPLALQAKLLRVLEERTIRRLGSSQSIPVDVRFVAATNRDLEREVAEGGFRQDLYFRVGGLVLRVPPLRERTLEIEPLARHFLEKFCVQMGISVPAISEAGLQAMLAYDWPGNVRELKNVMERAPLLSGGAPIAPEHLPDKGRSRPSAAGGFSLGAQAVARSPSVEALRPPSDDGLLFDETEEETTIVTPPQDLQLRHRNSGDYSPEEDKRRVLAALEACAGNQTRAAKLLGVSRRTLISRIDALGIPRPRK